MGRFEMAKLLTLTLLLVTLALAATADEAAPHDSDDEPRIDDDVDIGQSDDGSDGNDFDDAALAELERVDEIDEPADPFDSESDRRSRVYTRCRRGCRRGMVLSRYHRCRCVPRKCPPG